MDRQKKSLSVDDILNEYAAMEQEDTPKPRARAMTDASGDLVWRPANQQDAQQQAVQASAAAVQQHPAAGGRKKTQPKAKPAGQKKATSAGNPKPPKKKPEKKGKAGLIALCTVLALGCAGAGSALGYTYMTNTIFRGVRAGTVDVSGLSLAQAANKIEAEAGPLVENGIIPVKIYDKQYDLKISEVTDGVDPLESAQAAFDVGHKGGMMERVSQAVGGLFQEQEAKLVMKLDQESLKAELDAITAQAVTEPSPETWELNGTNLILTMPKPGVSFDREKVQGDILNKIKTMDFTTYEVKTELTEPQPLNVAELKQKVDRQPTNAIVDKTDGKTIIPEQNGIVMDAAQAQSIIGDGSAPQYTIPVSVTPATVTKEVLDRALFRDVLGTASTNLNTGNRDRTSNVTLAAKYMNETILNPGEEFSYNGIVGPRTTERGFKSAGAYANGKLIDDVGGGVCQPSSTLYMAVLRADLQVTERTNHSMTVAYTPLGQDATVSYGSLDFKFKNNTPYPIKIMAVREGGEMKTTIYGTKVNDKKVKVETEVLETLDPTTVEKKDASLKPGTKKVDQTATTGYKTVTYKYITENGETKKEVANHSSYRKRDKVVLVGPDQKVPATEPEQPKEPTGGTQEQTGTPADPAAGTGTGTGGTTEQPPAAPQQETVTPDVPSDPEGQVS